MQVQARTRPGQNQDEPGEGEAAKRGAGLWIKTKGGSRGGTRPSPPTHTPPHAHRRPCALAPATRLRPALRNVAYQYCLTPADGVWWSDSYAMPKTVLWVSLGAGQWKRVFPTWISPKETYVSVPVGGLRCNVQSSVGGCSASHVTQVLHGNGGHRIHQAPTLALPAVQRSPFFGRTHEARSLRKMLSGAGGGGFESGSGTSCAHSSRAPHRVRLLGRAGDARTVDE